MDPLYRQALPLIPPGLRVLDLGCGVGLLGQLLALRAGGNPSWGIEWDAAKARFAQRLSGEVPDMSVAEGDFRALPWPPCEGIALFDVLHYLPPEEQRSLLRRIADHLPPGGFLLLRVMDADVGGAARLTRACEGLAVALGWNRAARTHWRPLADLAQDFRAVGLKARLEPPPASGCALGNRLIFLLKEGPEASSPNSLNPYQDCNEPPSESRHA